MLCGLYKIVHIASTVFAWSSFAKRYCLLLHISPSMVWCLLSVCHTYDPFLNCLSDLSAVCHVHLRCPCLRVLDGNSWPRREVEVLGSNPRPEHAVFYLTKNDLWFTSLVNNWSNFVTSALIECVKQTAFKSSFQSAYLTFRYILKSSRLCVADPLPKGSTAWGREREIWQVT